MIETITEMLESLRIKTKSLDINSPNYMDEKNYIIKRIHFIQECYLIALIKKINDLSIEEKLTLINQITNITFNDDVDLINEYLTILIVGKDYYEKYKKSFISDDEESKTIQILLNSDSIYIDDITFNSELFDHKIQRLK